MPGKIDIEVRVQFRPEEPDGSICFCCGEQIFLKQFRAWVGVEPDFVFECVDEHDSAICEGCQQILGDA